MNLSLSLCLIVMSFVLGVIVGPPIEESLERRFPQTAKAVTAMQRLRLWATFEVVERVLLFALAILLVVTYARASRAADDVADLNACSLTASQDALTMWRTFDRLAREHPKANPTTQRQWQRALHTYVGSLEDLVTARETGDTGVCEAPR